MKKYFLFTPGFILVCIILFSGCKSNSPADPCNNSGRLCIENKMDSTVTVSIVQKHQQITLQKDFMECFTLEANQPYTVSISGSGYTKPDTTLMILSCDNKLLVVKQ
jgi:uncharacterized lipoprotein YajG